MLVNSKTVACSPSKHLIAVASIMTLLPIARNAAAYKTEAGREGSHSSVLLSCFNTSAQFTYSGLRSIVFVEHHPSQAQPHCTSTSHCYIEPELHMRALVMLPPKGVFDHMPKMTFPTITWKDGSIGVDLNENLLNLSPNMTTFRFELPRMIEADQGTFHITCIDQSKGRGPGDPSTKTPPTSTPSSSGLSKGHRAAIAIITIIILCIIAVVIAMFILNRKFGLKFSWRHVRLLKRSKPIRPRAPPSKDTLEGKKGNHYSGLILSSSSKKNADDIGEKSVYMSLNNNKESLALYVDPESNCSTTEPSFYDNKTTKTGAPDPSGGEYSYTYTEPKHKPKVLPKPRMNPRNKNKKTQGVAVSSNKPQGIAVPLNKPQGKAVPINKPQGKAVPTNKPQGTTVQPKTALKPNFGRAIENGKVPGNSNNSKGIGNQFKRQSSEIKYEDVE